MSLIASFLRDERGSLVSDIAKSVIAISLLAVLAANVIHHRIEPGEKERMAQVAAQAARGVVDPLTTGSLTRDIKSTRVDPCELPPRR